MEKSSETPSPLPVRGLKTGSVATYCEVDSPAEGEDNANWLEDD